MAIRSPVRTRSRNVRENKSPPTSTKADTAEDGKTRRLKVYVDVLVPTSDEKRTAFPGNHRKRRRINILERPETVDIDYPKIKRSAQPKCMVLPLPVRRKITAKPVDDSGAGHANADKLFKDISPMGGAHTGQEHRASKSGRRTSVSRDSDLQKPARASQVISGSQHSFAPPSRIPSRIHSCKVSSSSDCTRSTSTVWGAGLDATSRLSRQALAAYIFSLPLDESNVSDIEKPYEALPVSSSLFRASRSPERSKPGMSRIETPRPHARLFDSTANISTPDLTLPSSFDDVEDMLQSVSLANDRNSSLSMSVVSSTSSLDAIEQLLTIPRLEQSSACVSIQACSLDAIPYTHPSYLHLPVSPNDNHAEVFFACDETSQLQTAPRSPVALMTPSSQVIPAHCPSPVNTIPSSFSTQGRRVFGFCHLVLAFMRGALMGLGGLFLLSLAWIYFCYDLPEDRLQTFAL